ncbi:MAG TPA: glutamine synthetase family protein [Stellaceae bacterium]|nr:glutamine synthetase family protein [Stellaceae bacterium]
MASPEGSIGRANFIDAFALWSREDRDAAAGVLRQIEQHKLDLVRVSFADQHGLLRGKTLAASEMESVFRNGCAITVTLLAKDTAHRSVYPVFTADGGFGVAGMGGAGDMIMVPDPATFHVLPRTPNTGWILCDIHLKNGVPVPFSTRHLYRQALARLAATGHDFVAGLEIEFYVLKLENARLRPEDATQPATPPDVSLLARGYHYLTEQRIDQLDPVVQLLMTNLRALDLPVRSFESEFGPSQFEVTFDPVAGLAAADNVMLFRSAVKQVCHRHGYHATFMCRPAIPNLFASGWHLHQSLRAREGGRNAFAPVAEGETLSPLGLNYIGGLLRHARASCLFSTPTINGYKRYRPYSLAPDRAIWGSDHKGAMIRVVSGGTGDPGARLENRVGEPAANPYLYMASQVLSGLNGIEERLQPATPSDTPYESAAEQLPTSLMEATDALRHSAFYRRALSDAFVDYILTIKDAEIARFLAEVTDWEQREYFDVY